MLAFRKSLVFSWVILLLQMSSVQAVERISSSLNGKIIAGYQGWFSCPDDKTGLQGWDHWLNVDGSPAIDELPDTSAFPTQAGCSAPFVTDHNGNPLMLYSAQNLGTVEVQLSWLKESDISGVAVQRFLPALKNKAIKASRDVVLHNVRIAAEKTGRKFFICYDISGGGEDWAEVLLHDWLDIETDLINSPAYLFDQGRPVVEIWGLGVPHRPQSPSKALDLVERMKARDPGASIIAGVPFNWHMLRQLDSRGQSWSDVYEKVDTISPWLVNAFRNGEQLTRMGERFFDADLSIVRARNQHYMPVVFPGFSNYNETKGAHPFESTPRNCGRFLRDQLTFWKQRGVDAIYVAMFDEANEGTSIFKSKMQGFSTDRFKFLTLSPDCPDEEDLYLNIFKHFNFSRVE